MVADEQTHTLPSDREGLERFARFAGFKDRDAFARSAARASAQGAAPLHPSCSRTRRRGPTSSRCRFPKDADDRETLNRLGAMGFRKPLEVSATVRRWLDRRLSVAARRVRPRAVRRAGAGSARPAGARRRIPTPRVNALRSFPRRPASAAARLFSLLRQNPDLVTLVALMLGTAPRLADILAPLSGGDGCADRSDVLRRAAG